MDTLSYSYSYKQYKAGTKQVIGWLIEKSGYRSRRSTGNNNRNSTDDIPAAILPELARMAMKSLTSLDVPQHLRTILRQVISARKECAAHCRKKITDHTKQDQNDLGHEHFIRILEQISDIIGQTSQLHDTIKLQPESESRHINRFEHLVIEESIDQEVSVQDMKELENTKTVLKKESTVSELCIIQDLEQEALFAAFCFLSDCYRIRKYLRTVWNDFRSKKISLIAASLTTNMAFDVIAQIHFELSQDFPKYTDFKAFNMVLIEIDAFQSSGVKDDTIFTLSAWNEAYFLLKTMAERFKNGLCLDFHDSDNDMDWVKDCKMGVPTLTPLEKLRRLRRAIPDMLFFILHLDRESFSDELSSSILKLKKSQEVDVSMIVACEIFIDIHHTLLADIEIPFNHLLKIGKDCKVQMQKNAILSRVLNTDCSSAYVKETCDNLEELVHMALENDAVADFRKRFPDRQKENLTPFYLLRHHPVLCGMLSFDISMEMCRLGLGISTESQCITAAAHLYRALRQNRNLVTDWTDMEVYLSFYHKNTFKDMPYSSPSDWLKQLGLALGVPPSVLNPGPRMTIKIRDGMLRQYHKPQHVLCLAHINENQPLLAAMWQRHTEHGKKSAGMILREAIRAIGLSKSNKGAQILEEWNTLGQLSAMHTLEAILHGIQREEMHLCFNFMSLNRRCAELLRRLRNKLSEKFPYLTFPEAALQNGHMWIVVMILFLVAEAGNKNYLTVAAEVMKGMIEKEGNKEKTKLQNMPIKQDN